MTKRMSTKKARTTTVKVRKPKAIETAAFRFRADANGETRFTVTEARWLRDTLDSFLTSSGRANGPLPFDRSLFAYVHDRAITLGEFHANAERLLWEYGYGSHGIRPAGNGDPTMM